MLPEETSVRNLGSVQKTLLLPLWGRAVESRKPKPLLMDRTADEIINKLDYDFSTIDSGISFLSQLAWIARSIHIDRTVRRFLREHPRATIVNLGCGLDTTFERVDNGGLTWFDVDLPDVIRLRNRLISSGPRQKCIACSVLDEQCFHSIEPREDVLFIAAGVLYYFDEPLVRNLFLRIAEAFPGSEMVFDVCSPYGVRTANKRVIRDGGMDPGAALRWGIARPQDLEAWDKRIRVVETYRLFRGITEYLPLKQRIWTFISDRLRVMSMVRVELSPSRLSP